MSENTEKETLPEPAAVPQKLEDCADIAAREKFVQTYNASLNRREVEIAAKEKELKKQELELPGQLAALDQKQAIIAAKVAQNEEVLEKIRKGDEDLSKREAYIKQQNEASDRLFQEATDKLNALKNRELKIQENEQQIAVLKQSNDEKTQLLAKQADELQQKQATILQMNKDLTFQKREVDALQKKVQRLITLNNMEKEVEES